MQQLTQLPDGETNPRYPWFTAEDYAVDLEFKDQWHFVNSDENRMRLASYWTATMFLIDMAWDLNQMYDEPGQAAASTGGITSSRI